MESLYDRLGGETSVIAAVDILYRRILSDGRIAKFFENVDMEVQREKMRTLLTTVFGGPSVYNGKDMRQAHAHLVKDGLNNYHFDAVIENIEYTLGELKVPKDLAREVIAIANSVRRDVLAG